MAEKIRFSCENCGKSLSAKAEYAGRRAKCRACGNPIAIPNSVPGTGQTTSDSGYLNSRGGLSRIPRGSELSELVSEVFLFVIDFKRKAEKGIFGDDFFSLDADSQRKLLNYHSVENREFFGDLVRDGEQASSETRDDQQTRAIFLNSSGGLSRIPSSGELANVPPEAFYFLSSLREKIKHGHLGADFFSLSKRQQGELISKSTVKYSEWYDRIADLGGPPLQSRRIETKDMSGYEKPDFSLLKREHVANAIQQLMEGVEHGFADATKYAVAFEGRCYAPKALVGIAYQIATGQAIGPSDFSGGNGAGQANSILRNLGYDVVLIDQFEKTRHTVKNSNGHSETAASTTTVLPIDDPSVANHTELKIPVDFDHFPLDEKLDFLRAAYNRREFASLVSMPIATLTNDGDRHLPQVFLGKTIADFLHLSLYQIQREPGVGETKIHRVLGVLLRGLKGPEEEDYRAESSHIATSNRFPRLQLSALEPVPFAAIASSLNSVPSGVWDLDIRNLLGKSADALEKLPGVGPSKALELENQLKLISADLQKSSRQNQFCMTLCRREIVAIEEWCFRVVGGELPFDILQFRLNFVSPILKLIERDFDAEMRQIIEARIGLFGPPKTLREIGDEYGVTRERIRQKLVKVPEVVKARFPKGKTLLFLASNCVSGSIENPELSQLIRECNSIFFEAESHSSQTPGSTASKGHFVRLE